MNQYQSKKEDKHAEVELSTQKPDVVESDLELPVLEARSLEGVHSAFKKLHEEETEKAVVVDAVYTDSILEETQIGSAESFNKPYYKPILKDMEDYHAVYRLPIQESNLTDEFGAASIWRKTS